MSDSMTMEEREILYVVTEECSEVIKAIQKALRYGFDSFDPTKSLDSLDSNQVDITKEMGNVLAAFELMYRAEFIDRVDVESFKNSKLSALSEWLVHAKRYAGVRE